jgi:hypothetical protein
MITDASNQNYECKKRPFIWLNDLKFSEHRKSNILIKMLIFLPPGLG